MRWLVTTLDLPGVRAAQSESDGSSLRPRRPVCRSVPCPPQPPSTTTAPPSAYLALMSALVQ
eukprot:3816190-Pleurochrysis_carterae.AAC.1